MTSSNNNLPFKRILIIGLGVMGGSFCKKIATDAPNAELFIIEIDEETRIQAKQDYPTLQFITFTDTEILKTIDFVIVTMMPATVVPVFDRLEGLIQPTTVVIDISGIKSALVAALQNRTYTFQYALTHPMAGREKGGYLYSDGAIFGNCNYLIIQDVITLTDQNRQNLETFIHFLGTERITYMTAYNHDTHITYTSQLTHVLASSLLTSRDYADDTAETIGDSFRDLTRIADMNIPMWSHLFFENKELLAETIDNLIAELEKMKTSIAETDKKALHEQLAIAKTRRRSFK